MRIKTVRKKGKMKPKEKGKPLSYKKLDKSKATSARSIRGIYNGWKRAPKFILRLDSTAELRMYLGADDQGNGILIDDRNKAVKFAHGFDNPEHKSAFWKEKLGVKFRTENI